MPELESHKGHRQYIFTCDASDFGHLLVLDIDEEDPEYCMIGMESWENPGPWRGDYGRLRTIWRIIRGKPAFMDSVLLSSNTVAEMIEALKQGSAAIALAEHKASKKP